MLRRKDEGENRPAPHPHLHWQPGEMRSRTCGRLQLHSRQSEKSPRQVITRDYVMAGSMSLLKNKCMASSQCFTLVDIFSK